MDIKDMTIQDIQMELIKRASFNEFDGDAVAEDLMQNRNLWESALIDDSGVCYEGICGDLIKLRDMAANIYNVDTLYILSKPTGKLDLFKLAENWNADEVGWLDKDEASSRLGTSASGNVLRVWWD